MSIDLKTLNPVQLNAMLECSAVLSAVQGVTRAEATADIRRNPDEVLELLKKQVAARIEEWADLLVPADVVDSPKE